MYVKDALQKSLLAILEEMNLSWPEKTVIESPKDPRHGDLAVNIAMMLAREAKMPPRDLAARLATALTERFPEVEKAEVAGPGFLNVTFVPAFWHQTLLDIAAAGTQYGASHKGRGRKTLIEYVSANPTGPLHIGHGRGAAVGDTLARLMRMAGYDVATEYYVNDAGRQMRLLGFSVWLRAKELTGTPMDIPEDFYRGDYIRDIAKELLGLRPEIATLPDGEAQDICYEYAMQRIMDGIKEDLQTFRVEHQVWFSEKSLVERGAVEDAFTALARAEHLYEKDDALWFATTPLGDDKDRVLKKTDGYLTYFASDIAYHHDKFRRGFDYLIDIWGADHHGYIPRMRAAITAMERNAANDFDVVLIQLVNLLENGAPVSMSTRAGTFETLADVVKEVGVDAARFMFLSRKSDSPLDFDLELVKQRNMDNPVYYVQYAYARICTVMRRAAERGIPVPSSLSAELLAPLDTPEDIALLRKAAAFSETLASAAEALAVHHVSHYLMELSGMIHSYYAKHQILLQDNLPRAGARLALLQGMGQILANGLTLLGVSAPEVM